MGDIRLSDGNTQNVTLAEEEKANCIVWNFEKRYLPIKFTYFWTFAASGALLPFFATYYYEIGLTATELSLIHATVTFSEFFVRLIVSKLADATKHYKFIFAMCLVWTAVFHIPHMFVPEMRSDDAIETSIGLPGSRIVPKVYQNTTTATVQSESKDTAVNATMWPTGQRTWLFLVLLFLRLVASLGIQPALSLADTFGYAVTEGDLRLWGRQRCFSTFGFAFSSVVVGFILQQAGTHFYLFPCIASLCMVAAITTVFLFPLNYHTTGQAVLDSFSSDIWAILRKPQVVAYLLFTTVSGMLLAVRYYFLFLFLKESGGDELLVGLVQFVDSLTDLPMFYFSGFIVSLLGYVPCFCLSFFAYFASFLSYSYLTDPLYLVLLIQATTGFSFTLFVAAGTGYADYLTPPNSSATMQAIYNSFLFSLGCGLGDVFGGFFYPLLGARLFFRLAAATAGFCVVCYAMIWIFWLRKLEKQYAEEHSERQRERELWTILSVHRRGTVSPFDVSTFLLQNKLHRPSATPLQ